MWKNTIFQRKNLKIAGPAIFMFLQKPRNYFAEWGAWNPLWVLATPWV